MRVGQQSRSNSAGGRGAEKVLSSEGHLCADSPCPTHGTLVAYGMGGGLGRRRRGGAPLDSRPPLSQRLWAEPGRGVIDFAAVLDQVPDGYDGDFMIEIDVPSVDSMSESHRMAFDWARDQLPVS